MARTWTSHLRQSSLHGLKYLASTDITFLEKLFWCIILLVSTGICLIIGLQSVERFRVKNTVVSIERNFHYWHTAAPSTTVCPLFQRLNSTRIQQFCRQHSLSHEEGSILAQHLEQLANSTYFNLQYLTHTTDTLRAVLAKINLEPANYMQVIYNLTADRNIRTKLNKMIVPARRVLTEYGICYTTNTFLSQEYSASYLINGHISDVPKQEQILEITYYEKDATYIFEGFSTPIDVFIHSAFETMQLDHNYGYTNSSTYHEFESMETIVDKGFQDSTTVVQRQCRFQNESNLQHFPIYTKNLCLQECRLGLINEICKCIPHFYPNNIAFPKNVCSREELIECVAPNAESFLKLQMNHVGNTSRKGSLNCRCLPNCEDAIVNKKGGLKLDHTENLLDGNSIMITIINPPRQRLKRQIIFSATELLVSIGATAGLFLGFSLMSAIEALHWIILLLLFYMRKMWNFILQN